MVEIRSKYRRGVLLDLFMKPKVLLCVEADTLEGANLEGVNLEGANLQNKSLKSTARAHTNLQKAKLQFANLAGADLSGADLRDADVEYADFTDAKLHKARLNGLRFSTHLERVDFSGAFLQDANMDHANLEGANFRGANLHNAKLARHWDKGHGVEIVCSATLSAADFEGAMMDNINLEQIHLIDTNLNGADLSKAWLKLTRFEPGLLSFAKLTNACLEQAWLRGANLSGAVLTHARLAGADLSYADLRGADFRSAELRGVILIGARFDESTIWPHGFLEAIHVETNKPAETDLDAFPTDRLTLYSDYRAFDEYSRRKIKEGNPCLKPRGLEQIRDNLQSAPTQTNAPESVTVAREFGDQQVYREVIATKSKVGDLETVMDDIVWWAGQAEDQGIPISVAQEIGLGPSIYWGDSFFFLIMKLGPAKFVIYSKLP
jgi:uncharacterized protein YjbI with pentapeptide repeats